jgi:excisionase family DNA binding protein
MQPPVKTQLPLPTHGMTPKELARLLRVNADKVRGWIKSGVIGAVNVAGHQCGKPRFIVLPHHLEDFLSKRSAGPPPKPPRRRRRTDFVDFYPD